MEAKVLFCDPHLLVLEKPPGMLTQPTAQQEWSAEEFGKQWLQQNQGKERPFLAAVGRLDLPVGGLVLCARRSKALSRLHEALREGQFQKVYTALVEGQMEAEEGVLEHHLMHGEHRAHLVAPHHPQAKRCLLSYRVLERRGAKTLVEIHLQTGRYHQIRAQFAATGHPLLGDRLYGSKYSFGEEGIALHHTLLSIPHPMTGERMEWTSHPFFEPEPACAS